MFFGTSGSVPTAQRAPTALLARRGGERLLFDCAEGTQRQMLRSTVGLVELREVFLTHYHADHYLGLPGMLKTFALRGRDMPITIHGPPGLRDLFTALRRIFGRLTYEYALLEPVDSVARVAAVVRRRDRPERVVPLDGVDPGLAGAVRRMGRDRPDHKRGEQYSKKLHEHMFAILERTRVPCQDQVPGPGN